MAFPTIVRGNRDSRPAKESSNLNLMKRTMCINEMKKNCKSNTMNKEKKSAQTKKLILK